IPRGELRSFLEERVGSKFLKPGPVKDLKGSVLGQHKGIIFYTIGQRQGLGIAHAFALYVVRIDSKNNTLIVGEKKDLYGTKLEAKELHLLTQNKLSKRLVVEAKIRYNHTQAKATVRPLSKLRVLVEFDKPQWAITPGQSIVFYRKNIVIGGATIERSLG
ncbi:tRNA methyl transferase PRC-barrel domain-containing protein, partial [Thermoproteota archaeon]